MVCNLRRLYFTKLQRRSVEEWGKERKVNDWLNLEKRDRREERNAQVSYGREPQAEDRERERNMLGLVWAPETFTAIEQ